jgi:putative transposase
MPRKSRALPPSPFRRFNSSPEVIRLVVLMYVRFPLSLRNVEDLLFERGIDIWALSKGWPALSRADKLDG